MILYNGNIRGNIANQNVWSFNPNDYHIKEFFHDKDACFWLCQQSYGLNPDLHTYQIV